MARGRAIAVVGGGVIGLACALNLRRSGANVTVFDEATGAPAASAGNAGHIATEQVEPLASPAALRSAIRRLSIFGGPLDFRLDDLGTWGPWALRFVRASRPQRFTSSRTALSDLLADTLPAWRRLASSIGRPDLLREEGHFVLWEGPGTARSRLRSWSASQTGLASFQALDADRLGLLNRHLKRRVAGGIRFSGTGQISDLNQLLDGLRRALSAAGVQIRQDKATALAVAGGQASLVLEKGGAAHWDRIVVAAGVGSGGLMQSAGHPAPIIAERGYHIEGERGDWPDLPPVVFEDRSVIVTRFGDRLRVASFVEFGRPNAPPDARKWARLRRHADELGLPLREPISQWMGARPTLPDYLPAIGVSARAGNLIYAFGHQHLGLTLAAATGEIVADLAAGRPPATDLAPFDIARFDRRPPAKSWPQAIAA